MRFNNKAFRGRINKVRIRLNLPYPRILGNHPPNIVQIGGVVQENEHAGR